MNRFWRQQLHASTLILSGLVLMGLGVLALADPQRVGQWAVALNTLGLAGLSGLALIQRFSSPQRPGQPGWMGFVLLGLAILSWRLPIIVEVLIPVLYGVWAILRAISKGLTWLAYRMDHIRPRWLVLMDGIITLGFALVLLVDPLPGYGRLMWMAGAYALYLGSLTLVGGLLAAVQHRLLGQVSNLIASPIPLFLSLFIPQQVYAMVEAQSPYPQSAMKPLEDHQFEILFHMKRAGADAIGHVDLIHRGKIYSYGAHDPQKRRILNGFGDGVFIIAEAQPYLEFCLNAEHKRMVGYVIEPDASALANFETRLNRLLVRSIDWTPESVDPSQPIYAQRLQTATGARLLKFTSGLFKTYFAVSTNCVTLVEFLIGSPKIALIRLTPVLTPGMYFTLMNNAYRLNAKTIVQRRTY
jgi:uncharacterized membrane protein HdeD (DUF308 family)